jgi:predicted secreted protein
MIKIIISGIATLLLVSGCSLQTEAVSVSPPPVPVESADQEYLYADRVEITSGSVNRIKTGRIISISLAETQSIPYRWEVELLDSSLVKQAGDEIRREGVADNRPGSDGEVHVFYFEAQNAGECSINMNWVYLGDYRVDDTKSYTIVIED